MIGYQPRAVTHRGAKAKNFTVNGFVGMYDSKASASEQPAQAPLMINLMPTDPEHPSHATMRPGLTRMGTTTIRLGSGSNRTPQWVGLGVVINGVQRSPLVWCGGELFEITNFITGAFTKVLSTAQLAAAVPALTLSATRSIGAASFNGQIVFTQGQVRPFMWNGTTGGGITVLTNAPILLNGSPCPAVYYGKLFFIASDTEIQWSEENQPNVGYVAGGYNNAWQLTETGTSRLLGLKGSNEGLFYGRDGAIGVIRGAVSSTFSTDGVRESVSPNIGPSSLGASPAEGMLYVAGTLFWFDTASRPWAWQANRGVVALWRQMPRQFVQENSADSDDQASLYQVGEEGLANIRFHNLGYDPVRDQVYFNGTSQNNGGARISLVFDVSTLRPLCWQTYTAANKPTVNPAQWAQVGSLVLNVVYGEIYVDEQGYAFYRGFNMPTAGLVLAQYWDHTEAAPDGHAITGTILGPMHGWTPQDTDWHFDQVAVVVDGQATSVVTAGLLTSRAPNLVVANPQTLTDSASDVPNERAIAFGLNQSGRWARVLAQVEAGTPDTNDRPAIHGWRLRGYARGAAPSLP